MSEALKELAGLIEERKSDTVISTEILRGELSVSVTLSGLVDFIEFLKTDRECRFSTLVDVTAVDHPSREKRFDVVYHFLSMYQNHRIRVKVRVREDEVVPSITGVHASAGWFEREVFDMYGVPFSGHADLRRLLTDYGFTGHPLRKDFPTSGYTEVRYDEKEKRVVHEPISLTQE
ncbi:MAG: NADH-quinone oxidoreductase subunit C, partial [Paracoccaceae bacterium]